MPLPQWRTLLAAVLLTGILLYAARLRVDALFKSYGPYEEPRWLASIEPGTRSAAATITPNWQWRRVSRPYVGGDPITKIGLMLTGDADVGISLTSIAFGLLTLVSTYALGSLMASPAARPSPPASSHRSATPDACFD